MTTFANSERARSRPWGWILDRAGLIAGRAAERRHFRRTVSDLAQLDDRILRDIGLRRDQIRDVAAQDAARVSAARRIGFSTPF